MRLVLATIYKGIIHNRLLVRMGSNLCYWQVSQVEKLRPGPKPVWLVMFCALLHTWKECLGWPRKSFSCPAAHVPVLPSPGGEENPASLLSTQRHGWPGHSQRSHLAGARHRPIARLTSSAVDGDEMVVQHLTTNVHRARQAVGGGRGLDQSYGEAFPMGWLEEK